MVVRAVVVVVVVLAAEVYTQHTTPVTSTLHNHNQHLTVFGRQVISPPLPPNHTYLPFTVGGGAIELTKRRDSQRDITPLGSQEVYLPHGTVASVNTSQQPPGVAHASSGKKKLLHKSAGRGSESGQGKGAWGSEEGRPDCPHLAASQLVQDGFHRAVRLGLEECSRLWCSQVEGSEERQHQNGVYHVVQLGHVAEYQHVCLLNLTNMIVLHHSWPMCSSDFVCATNHSVFEMSASDCMPWQCWAAETLVLVFMLFVSVCITLMSVVIMVVTVACPQFHKPKYYLRFSLAATDFFIGIIVCGHAAYNQWVGLTEIPLDRFPYYGNLKEGQLFRHVPNCLWGVSDVLTQISGFFVTSNMIISLYTLSLMSLDRYLLLTRTHYRALVTSSRVTAALVMSWGCGLLVPSLHFVYRPQMQEDICINYDTSSFDVHIINIESKIATADYKVYLKHAVPLSVTLVVVGLPIISLLIFSFRALRKYNSYTRDRSVRQVKSALQLTQNHCTLSRQASSTSLAAMVNLTATPTHVHPNGAKAAAHHHTSTPPPYKIKYTFKKKSVERDNGNYDPTLTTSLVRMSAAGDTDLDDYSRTLSVLPASVFPVWCPAGREAGAAPAALEAAGAGEPPPPLDRSCRQSMLGSLGLRRLLSPNTTQHHVAATIRRLRGTVGGERVTVRERDREITCTVLVNVAVFIFACFPLLGVGGWMMFLYFTQQDTINNPAPLKQLLFVAPWLMALNSLWNAVLHLSYNHKFRSATGHMIRVSWRKVCRVFCHYNPLQQ